MEQVFISYSRRDLAFVKRLSTDLQAAGLKVWYDLSGLEVGTHWGLEIQNALDQSRFFIVILSPNSCRSEWVEREFLYASNHKLKIIPILYQPCDLPLWSLNLHFMELREENYRDGLTDLLRILGVDPGKEKGSVSAVMEPPAREEPVKTPPVPTAQPIQPAVAEIPTDLRPPDRQKKAKKEKPSGKGLPTYRPGPKKAWVIGLAGLTSVIILVLGIYFFGGDIKAALIPDKATRTITPIQSPAETFTPTETFIPTTPIDPDGIRYADGMKMVSVPEGEFTMGSDDGKDDEKPAHQVYLDTYWMDKTEVTNGMYAMCVSSGKCQPPGDNSSATRESYFGNNTYTDYPVINVDWYAAAAYCEWAGGRLPTEAEWEKAARGTDGWIYPWGDDTPTCSLANIYGCESDTSPVGSYLPGNSPYGIHDLVGNVTEWVADWYAETYYSLSPYNNPMGPVDRTHRVLRGSSWLTPGFFLQTSIRHWQVPENQKSDFGFRCAISANP